MTNQTCTIFDLGKKSEWKQALQSFPQKDQDVFLSPEYYEAFPNGKDARCFYFQMDTDKLLYPFFMKSLTTLAFCPQSKFSDLEGAYGYNGAASTTTDHTFIKHFDDAFKKFCDENNIIAEFTRFNPVYKNHQYFNHLTQFKVNKNFLVDLKIEDLMMNSYEHAIRKNVNKAVRENLSVERFSGLEMTNELFDQFVAIFHSTMDRNEASESYYFDKEFFQKIAGNLGDQSKFFFTVFQGQKISCELVLHNTYVGYSYLGGTNAEFYQHSPNVILKHEIIQYLKKIGLNYFCLGGGIKENDGIYKYKKSFAKNGEVDFYIGKRIYNDEVYQQTVKAWETNYPDKKDKFSQILLKYRL